MGFFIHQMSYFEFVLEFNYNHSWQINFVVIKSHGDFFPIYFPVCPMDNFYLALHSQLLACLKL